MCVCVCVCVRACVCVEGVKMEYVKLKILDVFTHACVYVGIYVYMCVYASVYSSHETNMKKRENSHTHL